MIMLDEVVVTVTAPAVQSGVDVLALRADLERLLGEHLAVVADELRAAYGDVSVDWS